MEFEDLFLTHYRAEKINGKMVITEDVDGKYRANSGEDVRKALTDNEPITEVVDVLVGKRWLPMGVK